MQGAADLKVRRQEEKTQEKGGKRGTGILTKRRDFIISLRSLRSGARVIIKTLSINGSPREGKSGAGGVNT